jgi:hypothetical protein
MTGLLRAVRVVTLGCIIGLAGLGDTAPLI